MDCNKCNNRKCKVHAPRDITRLRRNPPKIKCKGFEPYPESTFKLEEVFTLRDTRS